MMQGFDDGSNPFIQTGIIVSLVSTRITIAFYGIPNNPSKQSGVYYYSIPICDSNKFGPSCLPCNCSSSACIDTYYGSGCSSCQLLTQGPQCLACPNCNSTQTCSIGNSYPQVCGLSTQICNEGITGVGCRDCLSGFSGPNCNISCSTSCPNGICNWGIQNSGNCLDCNPTYYGTNCQSCTCNGFICFDGILGNGSCQFCPPGKYGSTCLSCSSTFGECFEGYYSNGSLKYCDMTHYGPNCTACSCVNGAELCDSGILGTGECIGCDYGNGFTIQYKTSFAIQNSDQISLQLTSELIAITSSNPSGYSFYKRNPISNNLLASSLFTIPTSVPSPQLSLSGNWIAILKESNTIEFRAQNSSDQWIITQTLVNMDSSAVSSLSLEGSYLVVGSSTSSTFCQTLSNLGAVHIYRLAGTSWTYYNTKCPLIAVEDYFFGKQVALYKNYLAILSNQDVTIFESSGGNWPLSPGIPIFNDPNIQSIALYNTILAVLFNDGDINIYSRTSALIWSKQTTIIPPTTSPTNLYSISLHQYTLVIGVPNSASNNGRAYVYTQCGNNWFNKAIIYGNNTDINFGSVAISDGKAVYIASLGRSDGQAVIYSGYYQCSTGKLLPDCLACVCLPGFSCSDPSQPPQNNSYSCDYCEQAFWGTNCDQPCQCNGLCHRDTGNCKFCKPLFYGSQCTACSENCSLCNDGLSGDGSCKSCSDPKATWGSSCTQPCNCTNGICDQETGACLYCDEGFYGPDCIACPCLSNIGYCDQGITGTGKCLGCFSPRDFTGDFCNETCSCAHGPCNQVGQCTSCDDGFVTQYCNQTCECQNGACNHGLSSNGSCYSCNPQAFGPECTLCNTTCPNGLCQDTINGNGSCGSCNAGYFGPSCIPCSMGCTNGNCNDSINGDGRCISCFPGYFGPDCLPCITSCPNGECFEGISGNGSCSACDPGYFGVNCSICNGTCLNGKCNNRIDSDGSCGECNSGFFGPNCTSCTLSCPNGKCNDGITGNGSCSSCNPGTWGAKCSFCSESCPNGILCVDGITGDGSCIVCRPKFFGKNCNPCTCNGSLCNDTTLGNGHCLDGPCLAGSNFAGPDCQKCCPNGKCNGTTYSDGACLSCNVGYFGFDCNSKCCPNGICENTITSNGSCLSCNHGFTGSDCHECSEAQDCLYGICSNKITGYCETCYPGFWGKPRCDKTCTCSDITVCDDGINGTGLCLFCPNSTHYYGPNCVPCNCKNGICDANINGTGACRKGSCLTSWSGDNCDAFLVGNKETVETPFLTTGAIAGIVVVIVLLFIGIIALIIWIKKRNNMVQQYADLPQEIQSLFKTKGVQWDTRDGYYVRTLQPETPDYEFLKFLFYDNLGGDQLELESVFVIFNLMLVTNFANYKRILEKRHAADPHLFKKKGWQENDKSELCEWIEKGYLDRVTRYNWNKDVPVPIMPALHGTDGPIAWKICNSGFATLAVLDAGWYGSGIYFTSDAHYALPYYATKTQPTLLLVFLLPGNIYPVTEHTKSSHSLAGKPIPAGYQSCYVHVLKNGQVCDSQKPVYYDEIVIGQEVQVMPVFLLSIVPASIVNQLREWDRVNEMQNIGVD